MEKQTSTDFLLVNLFVSLFVIQLLVLYVVHEKKAPLKSWKLKNCVHKNDPLRCVLKKLSFVKTLVLDGNPFSKLDNGSLHNVRAEFVSISKCPSLETIGPGAVTQMPALKALTLNDNRRLSYVDPAFIQGCPSMEALDLSRNSLYALERGIQASVPSLRALYLAGNSFNCHCRSVPNLDYIIILCKERDFNSMCDPVWMSSMFRSLIG